MRDGRPFVSERIVLTAARFPGLADMAEIPNTLYDLFQRSYGVLVSGADERLTAVVADARTARALGIERAHRCSRSTGVALALDGRPVEWRLSLVHLGKVRTTWRGSGSCLVAPGYSRGVPAALS